MRLIHTKTRQLKEFLGDDNVPPYAILSHTWGEEEVTYQDMLLPTAERKVDFKKRSLKSQAIIRSLLGECHQQHPS
jgi:hypothetical protein